MRTRAGRVLGAVVLTAGLVSACGGGGDGGDAPAAGASPGATTGAVAGGGAAGVVDDITAGVGDPDKAVVKGSSLFVSFTSGAWFLNQGLKPTGASVKQWLKTDKSFDWYADYAEPDQDQALTITGHLRPLAAQAAVLKKQGGKLTSTTVAGRKAVWSAPPGAAPVTVLIEFAPNYTIEFATSGVEVDQTLKLAAKLRPVDEAAWKASGGQVLDCPPGGDLCPN